MNWFELKTDQVKEIIHAAKNNKPVASLEEFVSEEPQAASDKFEDAVGQDSLTRFDKPKKQQKRKPRKNRKRKPQAKKNNRNFKKKKPAKND